jgi:D-3-phosphoglycerate dehydrogenase
VKKVLLSKSIHPAAQKILEGIVDLVVLPDSTEETAKKMVADVEGVILRTNIQFTRDIIGAAKRCRIISRTGVGVDNVDVTAATEKGIMVCNTPGVNTISVAEQTVALMLGLAKQILVMDRAVRAGNWKIRNANKAVDVEGKTLGLVGVGRIGTEVARKCRAAFAMRVIAYDPFVTRADGIELFSSLDQLFREADFISVHVPYSEQTHHLVNAAMMGLMKPDACLINTARGAVVDEKALAELLARGAIGGAGLDVLEEEPPSPQNQLFKLDNVVLTPHSAALSRECEMKVAIEAAQAVADIVAGRQPRYIYNKVELGLK